MRKVSYRDYCTGFYFDTPSKEANVSYEGGYKREWDVVAVVDKFENGVAYCTQRNRFFDGDELEAMKVGKSPERVVARNLKNDKGEIIEATNHPMMKFTFESEIILEQGDVLRKERPENQRVII